MTAYGNVYGYDAENLLFNIAAADTDVTIFVTSTGTETATAKYFAKDGPSTGFVIRPDATVLIVRLGSKTFRTPITVSTAGFTWTKNLKAPGEIVIRSTSADVDVELLVL